MILLTVAICSYCLGMKYIHVNLLKKERNKMCCSLCLDLIFLFIYIQEIYPSFYSLHFDVNLQFVHETCSFIRALP